MPNIPDAAILCGGMGTRLQAALPNLPKAMAPVGGCPFLEHLVGMLEGWGTIRIVLCVGVGAAVIRRRFEGRQGRAHIEFSEERTPMGTAGALALALPHLHSDPVLVLNGDSLVPGLDMAAFLTAHRRAGAGGALVVVPADERRDAGALTLDDLGRVAQFAEKAVQSSKDAGGRMYHSAGIYLLSRAWMDMIPAGRPASLEHELMPRWQARGMMGYAHAGRLVDIGTPERLAQAQAEWTS